jgi:hypothetical protein
VSWDASFNDADKTVINVNLKEKRNQKRLNNFFIGPKKSLKTSGRNSMLKEKYTKVVC